MVLGRRGIGRGRSLAGAGRVCGWRRGGGVAGWAWLWGLAGAGGWSSICGRSDPGRSLLSGSRGGSGRWARDQTALAGPGGGVGSASAGGVGRRGHVVGVWVAVQVLVHGVRTAGLDRGDQAGGQHRCCCVVLHDFGSERG